MSRPAHGSMAAHDALAAAWVDWCAAEAAFDKAPRPDQAAEAEDAWRRLGAHAINCGLIPASGEIERRVQQWARLCGVDPSATGRA